MWASKKGMGRPKKGSSSVLSTFSILIPVENDKYDSDVVESEELSDGRISDKEGDKKEAVHYEEYDEQKHKYNPSLELGMKFSSLKQFKDACRNYGIKSRF